MPGALPSNPGDEVAPQCMPSISREHRNRPAAARNRQGVEHEQMLFHRRIPPRFLLPPKRRQPQSSNDPMDIGRSVVLDFNPPALIAVMDDNVRRQMLLQSVLKIFYRRPGGAQFARYTTGLSP